MPRLAISQYIARETPQGYVRGVIPGAVDTSGLSQGVANASAIVTHQARIDAAEAERLKAIQEHEAKQLAKAEAGVAEANAYSAAQSNWTERLYNAQKAAPADALNFTADTLKEFDTWSEQEVAKLPPESQVRMREKFAGLRNQIHARAFDFEVNARNAKIGGDYMAGLETDRKALAIDPTQIESRLAGRLDLLKTLGMGAEATAKIAEETRHQLAKSAAEGIVSRTPEAFLQRSGMAGKKLDKNGKPLPVDPAKAAEAIKSDPIISNLKPEALTALVEQATNLVQTKEAQRQANAIRAQAHAEAVASKNEREAGRAYTILRDMLVEGRVIDPNNAENQVLIAQMRRVPEYANAFAEMQKDTAATTAAATQPLDVQRAQLNALYAQRNAQGTSPGLQTEIDRRQKVLSAAETAYKDDPLTAGLSRGVITSLPPLDMTNVQTLTQGLSARIKQADVVAQKTGGFVSPFTAAEARQVSDMLDKMPAGQKEAALAAITNGVGMERIAPTMAQLGKHNIRLAVAGGLYGATTTAGRSTSRNIIEGDELLKSKQFTLPPDRLMAEEFAKQVGNALPVLEARGAAFEAAKAIYARTRFADGHAADKALDTSAWAGAVSQVTGGIVTYKGQRLLPVRYGASQSETTSLLRGVNSAQVKQWGGVDGMTDEEAATFIKEAQLESVSVGRYHVMAGASILRRKDGKPFEMVYR